MAKSKKRKSKNKLTVSAAPRNPLFNHPLMAKGGAHGKSRSAERSKARRETQRMARDWASSFWTLLIS